MTEATAQPPGDEPWTPSRATRIAVGLLAGAGATEISAGLGLIGTRLDIDLPLVDPSSLILMAPVVVVPGLAGAVLRGRAAVIAITAGAVASPIGAVFAIDGSCQANMFVAIGLAAAALFALVAAGLASLAGERIGDSPRFANNRQRGVLILVVLGAVGALGWIAALAILGGCP
jgi:hypothetical protein